MLWLLAIFIEIILETLVAIRYRTIARSNPQAALTNTAITYVAGVFPVAVIYALVIRWSPQPPDAIALTWITSAAVLFALANVVIYRIYSHIEASVYTVINSVKYVAIIALAYAFLGDALTPQQTFGALLIIGSALTVAYVLAKKKQKHSPVAYMVLAFVVSLGIAVASICERTALGSVSAATYMLYGWGLQAVILCGAVYVTRSRSLTSLKKTPWKPLIELGVIRGLSGVCIVYAVATTQNISLVASLTAVKIIAIAVTSYIVLGERTYWAVRLGAAAVATAGIVLLVWR